MLGVITKIFVFLARTISLLFFAAFIYQIFIGCISIYTVAVHPTSGMDPYNSGKLLGTVVGGPFIAAAIYVAISIVLWKWTVVKKEVQEPSKTS